MKKQVLTLAFLLALALAGRGQYESFFGNESWEYNIDYLMTCYTNDYDPNNIFGVCCETISFEYNKQDTISIGGCFYFKNTGCLTPNTFLREDTANGRLYARYSTDISEDEYLLCDMSLLEGDTFVLRNGAEDWIYFEDKTMVVDSIGYPMGKKVIYLTLLDSGSYREDFFFESSAYNYMAEYNISLRFMEGVGPMYGIHPPISEPYLGALLCLHKDDSLYYMTHETLGCDQFGAGITIREKPLLRIYPNPSSQYVIVESVSGEELSGKVFIRDIVGRVCCQQNVSGQLVHIPVESLPQGVYILTYMDEQNNITTRKFVKE